MTVKELIELLLAFENQEARVYMQGGDGFYVEPTYLAPTPDEQGCDIQSVERFE